MSSTKCKIPLGWFFGEIADFVFYNEPANATNLISFHQDLLCRFRYSVQYIASFIFFIFHMKINQLYYCYVINNMYSCLIFRLAVGKLTDCLDFYLEMFGGSASHMTAEVDQQNDSYSLVRSTYQVKIGEFFKQNDIF